MESAAHEYFRWLKKLSKYPDYLKELAGIDEEEVLLRFQGELEFGTGGLRGELGMGTARMNVFTVERATQGLAEYLLSGSAAPSAVIAYDTRKMSYEFAEHAACVLCANGIKTYLFDSVRPTPMLSFAVRYLEAEAGIVITASHNPKQYNGYKVYGSDGGQITDKAASEIFEKIKRIRLFEDAHSVSVQEAKNAGFLQLIGENVDAAYFDRVKELCLRRRLIADEAKDFRILYTPLHGSGNIPVRRVLRELGFLNVDVVKEQELPDGDFPTAEYPNPEEPDVFKLALKQAEVTKPDLIFATDPDCDRIGVLCAKHGGGFEALTGNQIGTLLCDYIVKTQKEFGGLPENAAVVKTIVTSRMVEAVCENYNVRVIDVLTGFKYIGEIIGEWDRSREYSFVFGLEESYGYLRGSFVRDKDAVIASVLIAEMALFYKQQGLSLLDVLQRLYSEYGYYAEKLITLPAVGQAEGTGQLLSKIRDNLENELKGQAVFLIEDYETLIRSFLRDGKAEKLHLPKSNVIKIIFEDGCWLAVRPSGTEPKIKIYIGTREADRFRAHKRMDDLINLAKALTRTWGNQQRGESLV